MIRNPITLLVLALAMLLAPLGVCVGRGHVQTGTATAVVQHAAGVHGSASEGHGHSDHEGSGKHHFCGDCQPPGFVGASKAGTDAAPSAGPAPAIIPAVAQIPSPQDNIPVHSWYGRAPPIPPPLPLATRVRLQI